MKIETKKDNAILSLTVAESETMWNCLSSFIMINDNIDKNYRFNKKQIKLLEKITESLNEFINS